MGETIDSLEIQIKSDSKAATVALDNLTASLGRLSSALGSISGRGFSSNMSAIMGQIRGISSAISSMDSERIKTVSSAFRSLSRSTEKLNANLGSVGQNGGTNAIKTLASGLREIEGLNINSESISQFSNSITKLGYKSATMATKNIPSLINSLKTLGQEVANMPPINNIQGLNEFASSIRALGGKTATAAIDNIPKVAEAVKKLIVTLSSAPTVRKSVIDLTKALADLTRNTANVGTVSSKSSKGVGIFSRALNAITSNANRASKSTRSLAGTIGKIYATYFLLFRGIRKLWEAMGLASSMTEVENVVNQTFGASRDVLDAFANESIKKFGMSTLSVEQYASRFQAMGKAMGITGSMLEKNTAILGDGDTQYGKSTKSMAEMSTNLTKLTADIASFYEAEQSVVAEDLYSVFTGTTKPLRKFGIDLTQANLKEWALKKGIDANVDSMTQAQKSVLRYAYTLDAAKYAMGDFERTSDRLTLVA